MSIWYKSSTERRLGGWQTRRFMKAGTRCMVEESQSTIEDSKEADFGGANEL